MKLDLPLATFVKSLYPTHFNYLESVQASDNFKGLTFDTLVENIADREKAFGKKSNEPNGESICFVQKENNLPKTLPREIAVKEDEEEEISKVEGE